MKIELLVDTKNHKAGTKLNVEYIYAKRMISNGTAKDFSEKIQENVVEEKQTIQPDPKITISQEVEKPKITIKAESPKVKPKGRPKRK